MTTTDVSALVQALRPILSRVRTDVSALKVADGSSRWTLDPLNKERMIQHVLGKAPRGVCPIKEGQSTTQIGLLDLDSHGGETSWDEMSAVARDIMDFLDMEYMHPVAFRSSGGRGIHIYLLWAEPQDAFSVREYLADVLRALGYRNGTKGVVNKQIEIFPKQDAVGPGEFGNQFILPLAGKSEPLVPGPGRTLVGLGKAGITEVEWADSEPVTVREREVVSRAHGADGVEPIEKVRAALAAIPNDGGQSSPDYDRWRDLAFAVHEATGGSDEGMQAFIDWSAQNPKFDEKFFVDRVWDYIKPSESRTKAITRGTLYGAANLHGFVWGGVMDDSGFEDVTDEDIALATGQAEKDARAKFEAKVSWKKAIEDCRDEFELQEKLAPKIARDLTLKDIDRQVLAEALKVQLAKLGTKVGLPAVKKLIAPARVPKDTSGLPDWLKGYVFVTDNDKFFNMDSDEWLTTLGFNAKHARYMPDDEDGPNSTATWVALKQFKIPTVTRAMYVPYLQPMFQLDGIHCVNTFRPSSVPKPADKFTDEGRQAVHVVKRHILMLCKGREKVAKIIEQWIAHNVQKPGVKVLWAPLIRGTQGDGKTALARLLITCLGASNVKEISPRVLYTDFSGWAMGACVGVLEEVRLTGHNRHDVANALKPYITNLRVAIHKKGVDEFNAINTMNYIAFTNFYDALPLDDGDRRYMVVDTGLNNKEELLARLGEAAETYFSRLFDWALGEHHAQVSKYFHQLDISDFNPNATAPWTDEKGDMVRMSQSDDEATLLSVIEAGAPGVSKNVLSTAHLSHVCREQDAEFDLRTSSLARVLGKHGWKRFDKPVKWMGSTIRVWVRKIEKATPEDIRSALDATMPEGLEVDPFA